MQWPIFHDIPEAFTKSLSFTGGAEEWPPMVIRSPFLYSAFWVEALITSVAQNHVLLLYLMSAVRAGPRVNPRQLQLFQERRLGSGRDMLLLAFYQGGPYLGSDLCFLLVEQGTAIFHGFPEDSIY